jgi:hypothetical protein
VEYDAADDTYSMTEEQAFALTNPDGGVYVPGAFVSALGSLRAVPRITEAFRSGGGLGWHEQDADVFTGCEQFFRPGYIADHNRWWRCWRTAAGATAAGAPERLRGRSQASARP